MSLPEDTVQAFAATVRDAGAAGQVLRLRGGGTKDFYGQSFEGEVLNVRGHAGIVAHETSELYITARCGTPLAGLESALRERGQMLAFEPPHFGGGNDAAATVGGMVAAGLSGPRRQAAGAVRDFVLGVTLMDGRGEILVFGGQVMKNVAGYDVSRLMAGSLGTLGIILDVSLKVLPLPAQEATLKLELPEDRAIETLNRWGGRPLPISASCWVGGNLRLRLSGARAAVNAACEKIGGERMDDEEAQRFWAAVRDQRDAFFADDAPLWRVSLPSASPRLGIPGGQLIEWGGALRWLQTRAGARTVREAAKRAGGHATLFRGGDKSVGVFQPLPAPLMNIHRNLKREFDPQSVFNRGRMYPDF